MQRLSTILVLTLAAACSRKSGDAQGTGSGTGSGTTAAAAAPERVEATVYGEPSKDARIDGIQFSATGLVALVTKAGAPPARVELAANGTSAKLVELTAITGDDLYDVALSPDGATLAVVRREAIELVKGSEAPVRLPLPADRSPTRAAFAADGSIVVVAADETGFRLLAFDATPKHALRSDQRAFYSSDGSDCTLALGADPDLALIENCHGARAIRVHDGALLAEWSPSGTSEPAGFAEVARGQFAIAFVVGEDDPAFELWLPSGLPGPRMKDASTCVIAPTGRLAACDHSEGEVIVFEPASYATRLRVHVPESVSALRFTPDGSRLVIGLHDTRIALVDTSQAHASAPALPVGPSILAIDPKQPTARDAPWRKLAPARTIEVNDAPIRLATSRDNRRLAVLTASRGALIYDLAKPTASPLDLFDFADGIHTPEMAWSPDGALLAVVEAEPNERLVLRTTKARDDAPREVTTDIKERSVAWSSKGLLATGGPSYGTIQIWNADTLAKTHVLEPANKQWLGGLAFAPDGRLLAWGDWTPTMIWNAETGTQVRALAGHAGSVFDAAWSLDGKLLVTLGRDRAIVVWDGAKLEPLAVLRGADPFTIAISPDGKRLAGSDLEGITIWSLPDGKPLYRIEQSIARPKLLVWPGPLVVGTQNGLALFTPSRE